MKAVRLLDRPLITAASDPSIGDNIQGPSLIRVPTWVDDPLGVYYLYFADHKGDHIRMAYAEDVRGPWTIRPGGVLRLVDSGFLTKVPEASEEDLVALERMYTAAMGEYAPIDGFLADLITPHIASPDVRVDETARRISMYFHGLDSLAVQATRYAESSDGLEFTVDPEAIAGTYLRAFRHRDVEYALTVPGRVIRRIGGPTEFEAGPDLLPEHARHSALNVIGDNMQIYWTQVGDTPERILCSLVDLSAPWMNWTASDPVEVLRPERSWEGADQPLEHSRRGAATGLVNQLRDPAIFVDLGRTFMVYAIGGESGLALAELTV